MGFPVKDSTLSESCGLSEKSNNARYEVNWMMGGAEMRWGWGGFVGRGRRVYEYIRGT